MLDRFSLAPACVSSPSPQFFRFPLSSLAATPAPAVPFAIATTVASCPAPRVRAHSLRAASGASCCASWRRPPAMSPSVCPAPATHAHEQAMSNYQLKSKQARPPCPHARERRKPGDTDAEVGKRPHPRTQHLQTTTAPACVPSPPDILHNTRRHGLHSLARPKHIIRTRACDMQPYLRRDPRPCPCPGRVSGHPAPGQRRRVPRR